MTPEATAAIARGHRRRRLWALSRSPDAARPTSARHASDNRVELDRARLALRLASEGRTVAVVSGGDPGVFAMAAAVFEAIEAANPAWRALDVDGRARASRAMQAAAARLGAPLGHDFCAISLSDNLKPWAIVARRLSAAAEGDFVIALYNPASKARPTRIVEAFDLLRRLKAASTPVAFARAVGRPDERLILTTLGEADVSLVDMATLVLDRLQRDALCRAGGRGALDADAALLRGRAMRSDPVHDGVAGRASVSASGAAGR